MLNNKAEEKLENCVEENGKKVGNKPWNATCIYKTESNLDRLLEPKGSIFLG